MAVTLGTFCLGIVLASVLGGMLPLATVLNHTRLQIYLSFSAGAMLGAAFFHMLPEAVRAGSPATIPWAAVGLLGLFFLERFFSFHHHEPHDHREADSHGGVLNWGPAAFGLGVHSLVGGIALASAVAADYQVRGGLGAAGLGVFMATLVHKPADALTITSLMIKGGRARRETHLINLGFALMIPLGVVIFAVGLAGAGSGAVGAWTSGALAFSAGTFLCIALSDLLPELQFHSHDRLKLSIALLAGIALMALTAAVERPDHDPAVLGQAGMVGPIRPFGDPNWDCAFTHSNLRLLRDANQNVGVIAHKRAGKVGRVSTQIMYPALTPAPTGGTNYANCRAYIISLRVRLAWNWKLLS